jgi:hypothetical protein
MTADDTQDPRDRWSDRYRVELIDLVAGFEFERCHECDRDVDSHTFSPDPLGHPHAWCMTDE